MKEFLLKLKERIKFGHLLIIGYVLFMAFAYGYVNRVLKEGDLKVTTKEKESGREIKPVSVKLILKVNEKETEYRAKLNNVDSIRDFLDKLQDDRKFSYERTFYSDGVVIDEVNGSKPEGGFLWRVLRGEEDLTDNLDKEYLKDDETYTLTEVQVHM